MSATYNPSIYEQPFLGTKTIRGEEGADVTAYTYWSPDIEDTFRCPLGLHNKYIAALVTKSIDISTTGYNREGEEWAKAQPMSYWLAETAKKYNEWGVPGFGPRPPLLPKFNAMPEGHCIVCSAIISDSDDRAVQDYWERADASYIAACSKCAPDAIRNTARHYIRQPEWHLIRKGELGTEFRASKWEEEWNRRK